MIRYLNLPSIPQDLVDRLVYDFDQYERKWTSKEHNYTWSDSFNEEINEWCRKNICEDMYFAFAIIEGNIPPHKDGGTLTKLSYLLRTGGDNVITSFYNEEQTEVTHAVKIEPFRWHLIKTDAWHGVQGIEPGQTRFSLIGRVFPE